NVLVALSKSKQSDAFALTARARMIKARTLVAEEKNAEAAREYHWLATEAAIMDAQEKFDEKAAQLDPKLTLNEKERMARLQAFADKGLVAQVEAEIEALKKLSLALASPNKTDQHLAWAVFVSRTDYTRAAELFAKAAS